MIGVLITSNGVEGQPKRRVRVDYNGMATILKKKKASFKIAQVTEVDIDDAETRVMVVREFPLPPWVFTVDQSYTGKDMLIVQKVDDTIPQSNDELFELLDAIFK